MDIIDSLGSSPTPFIFLAPSHSFPAHNTSKVLYRCLLRSAQNFQLIGLIFQLENPSSLGHFFKKSKNPIGKLKQNSVGYDQLAVQWKDKSLNRHGAVERDNTGVIQMLTGIRAALQAVPILSIATAQVASY